MSTVSRYLGKRLRLPLETADRIDLAVTRLDYRPSVTAQRLSHGKAETIGFVTPDIANPFFAALAGAVEEHAALQGYSVILCSTGSRLERERGHLDRLAAGHFDGLLFLTNHGDDGTLRHTLAKHRNIVLLDEDVPGVCAHRVFVENEAGGAMATTYLLQAGHRRIAHVTGPSNLFSAKERFIGYRRALERAGLAVDPDQVLYGAYDRAFGQKAARVLLGKPERPTAIFAASDYIAIGLLDVLHDHGISVPEDMSLVGHCHINRKGSRLSEERGLKGDHAAFRAHVSSCQTWKARARIIR